MDEDWFAFEAEARQAYVISVMGLDADEWWPSLTLYGPEGMPIYAGEVNYNEEKAIGFWEIWMEWVAPSNGKYFIQVMSSSLLENEVAYWVAAIRRPGPSRDGLADMNGDARIDGEDLMLLGIVNWQQETDQDLSRTRRLVDFDGNGLVDSPDLIELARLYHSNLLPREMAIRAMILWDFPQAQSLVEEALRTDPTDPELNLYMAAVRLVNLIEAPSAELSDLLTGFQASIGLFPEPIWQFPDPLPFDSPNVDDVFTFIRGGIQSEINLALTNLENARDHPGIQLKVSLGEEQSVEIDIADVYLMMAGLQFLLYRINFESAYDWNTDIDAAMSAPNLTIESFLHSEADFGRLRPASSVYLTEARQALEDGLENLEQGVLQIGDELDYQGDDLLMIDEVNAQETLKWAANVRKALNNPPFQLAIEIDQATEFVDINLSRLFSNPVSRLDYPTFVRNQPAWGTFPNPDFSGLLPGMTQQRLAFLAGAEVPPAGSVSGLWEGTAYITDPPNTDYDVDVMLALSQEGEVVSGTMYYGGGYIQSDIENGKFVGGVLTFDAMSTIPQPSHFSLTLVGNHLVGEETNSEFPQGFRAKYDLEYKGLE